MVKSIRCGFYSTLWLNWLKMHHIIPYNFYSTLWLNWLKMHHIIPNNFDSTYWNVVQLNCPRYPLRQNRIHNHQ